MIRRTRRCCCSPFFGSLRWGELAALRRRDVDLQTGAIQVSRQLTELGGGGYAIGPPKSAAGKRIVVIPKVIIAVIREHFRDHTQPGDEGLVFTSPEGMPLGYDNSGAESGGLLWLRPGCR